jgi:hypothetical protein
MFKDFEYEFRRLRLESSQLQFTHQQKRKTNGPILLTGMLRGQKSRCVEDIRPMAKCSKALYPPSLPFIKGFTSQFVIALLSCYGFNGKVI